MDILVIITRFRIHIRWIFTSKYQKYWWINHGILCKYCWFHHPWFMWFYQHFNIKQDHNQWKYYPFLLISWSMVDGMLIDLESNWDPWSMGILPKYHNIQVKESWNFRWFWAISRIRFHGIIHSLLIHDPWFMDW